MKSVEPTVTEINAQYIIDKSGKKTGVILDIETFEKLMEEIEDFYFGKLAESLSKEDKEEYE